MMKRTEFAQAMAVLQAAIGKESIAKETVEAWFLILGDLTAEQFKMGIITTLRSHEFHGLPPVGLIRKNAGAVSIDSADRAVVAWWRVKSAIATHGSYESVVFDDPLINATIRALGGWIEVCGTESGENFDVWLFRRFKEMYATLLACGVHADEAAPLPGICDVENSRESRGAPRLPVAVPTGLPRLPAGTVRGEQTRQISVEPIRNLTGHLVESLGLPAPEDNPSFSNADPVPKQQMTREEALAALQARKASPSKDSVG
jgi:hypothetical protein